MKKKIQLMAAPTAMEPGGYMLKAYLDRTQPMTPSATLETKPADTGWILQVSWPCPEPIRELGTDTNLFVDAAALLTGGTPTTSWITMGLPGDPVEAALWRADRETLYHIHAEGLGTVKREEARGDWKVTANWESGTWHVVYEIPSWPLLAKGQQLAVAIWRGAAMDRGGLKSVSSQGWTPLT